MSDTTRTLQRHMNDTQQTCHESEAIIKAKSTLRQWFKAKKSRLSNFYTFYYNSEDAPSLKTVQRVIYKDFSDHHNILSNAAAFYKECKESEFKITKILNL